MNNTFDDYYDDRPTKDEAQYEQELEDAHTNSMQNDSTYEWRYNTMESLQYLLKTDKNNLKLKRIFKKFKDWTDEYIKQYLSDEADQNLLDSDPHAYYGVHPSMFH